MHETLAGKDLDAIEERYHLLYAGLPDEQQKFNLVASSR